MGFLKLLERTPTRLHYVRRPSYRSWMVLIGLSLLGISIAASSTGYCWLFSLSPSKVCVCR
eukprot:m.44196 g.44196  ORF g.44196 m.44196 type:complete len:61 (+) comp33502_c0_seq4:19-201(+)